MSNIKYSVFRYTPSFITAESIVLGIIIDVNDDIKFYHTRNYDRVIKFDDELDLDYLKFLLESLEKELSTNLFNTPQMIYDKKRHFVNEFSFDDTIETKNVENTDLMIEQLKRLYLKYDYEKSNRLTKKDEFKLINIILRSRKIKYEHNAKIFGDFSDRITYDYIIGEYGIKFLSFNNKDLSKTLNSVKSWAWNCSHNKKIKTVFIYDCDSETYTKNSSNVNMLLNILKHETKDVYNIEDGIKFIDTIQ